MSSNRCCSRGRRFMPGHFYISQIPLTTWKCREQSLGFHWLQCFPRFHCLGRVPTDSNGSNSQFSSSVFSLTWGICFSLKANPNGSKNMAFWHTFGTGTRRHSVLKQAQLLCRKRRMIHCAKFGGSSQGQPLRKEHRFVVILLKGSVGAQKLVHQHWRVAVRPRDQDKVTIGA
jgi:hypothetical protein